MFVVHGVKDVQSIKMCQVLRCAKYYGLTQTKSIVCCSWRQDVPSIKSLTVVTKLRINDLTFKEKTVFFIVSQVDCLEF